VLWKKEKVYGDKSPCEEKKEKTATRDGWKKRGVGEPKRNRKKHPSKNRLRKRPFLKHKRDASEGGVCAMELRKKGEDENCPLQPKKKGSIWLQFLPTGEERKKGGRRKNRLPCPEIVKRTGRSSAHGRRRKKR